MSMRVSKITIGRLHNLGNYEHVRYEMTVEVPEGESAATALIGAEKILNALAPKRPCGVPSEEESERQANTIATVKAMAEENWQEHYYYKGSRTDHVAELEKNLTEGIEARKRWEAQQARARKALEDIGGAANWKDAKMEWEDY